MEDYRQKYIHKLSQLVTTLKARKKISIDLMPKIVKNSDFPSILCTKTQEECREPKFRIKERVLISEYYLPFRKVFKPSPPP